MKLTSFLILIWKVKNLKNDFIMSFVNRLNSKSSETMIIKSFYGCLKMDPKDLTKKFQRPKAHQLSRDFLWDTKDCINSCSTNQSLFIVNDNQ